MAKYFVHERLQFIGAHLTPEVFDANVEWACEALVSVLTHLQVERVKAGGPGSSGPNVRVPYYEGPDDEPAPPKLVSVGPLGRPASEPARDPAAEPVAPETQPGSEATGEEAASE